MHAFTQPGIYGKMQFIYSGIKTIFWYDKFVSRFGENLLIDSTENSIRCIEKVQKVHRERNIKNNAINT